MMFTKYRELYNHHLNPVLEPFHHPGNSTIFGQSLFPPPAHDNHRSAFCFYKFAFLGRFM